MRSTGLIAAIMTVVIAMEPLTAQGKGKGGGNDDGSKGRSGNAVQGQPGNRGKENKTAERARPSPNDGRNERAESKEPRRGTSSDRRIERQQEREFAGDVDLPGRARSRAVGRNRFVRSVVIDEVRPSVRRFFVDDQRSARAAVGAVTRAHMRGVDDGDLVITPLDDHLRILNRDGVVLVALDEERVRNLGRWEVIPIDDDVPESAPAFCRSGEGHPVFGRQWCIDKRFGLGGDDDFRWGRTDRITDLVFLQPINTGSLTRDALLGLLGPVAFDRLALHAITLGLSAPLTGRWMVSQEPGAPSVLLVSSGKQAVAEVVDIDRDGRADLLVVALRDW